MKIANRILMLVLGIIILILNVGCGQKNGASLLPFDLEFGDTYEEVQKAIDIGELKNSSANEGYVSNLRYLSEDQEIIDVLGTCDGISGVAVAFSFNAEEKLYEYYCFFTVEGGKLSQINDAIRQKYNEIAGEEEEDPDGIALWINDKYSINYLCNNRIEAFLGEDASCTIAIHSFELDFE